jgi:hypothetical protein
MTHRAVLQISSRARHSPEARRGPYDQGSACFSKAFNRQTASRRVDEEMESFAFRSLNRLKRSGSESLCGRGDAADGLDINYQADQELTR